MLLQDIEKGKHNDKECEEYCRKYKIDFGQELPDCQFKGNKSKIQNLIRKVHVDANGRVTEVQFELNDVEYLLSKMLSKIEDLEVNLSAL